MHAQLGWVLLGWPETIENMRIAPRVGRGTALGDRPVALVPPPLHARKSVKCPSDSPPQTTKPVSERRSYISSEEKESDAFHVHVQIVRVDTFCKMSIPRGPPGYMQEKH